MRNIIRQKTETHYLRYIGRNRDNNKMILKQSLRSEPDSSGSAAGSCEHGNELPGSRKCRELL
jgi:hypothetical protein